MTTPSKRSGPSSPGAVPKKRKPSSTLPEPGAVLNYSYLWEEEYRDGRDEGVKDRPVAVVIVTVMADGLEQVIVAALSTSPPRHGERAIEVPSVVRRQLRLSADRSWGVVCEVNRFTWPGYDIRPVPGREPETRYGTLPSGFFRQVRDAIFAGGIGRVVDRDD